MVGGASGGFVSERVGLVWCVWEVIGRDVRILNAESILKYRDARFSFFLAVPLSLQTQNTLLE